MGRRRQRPVRAQSVTIMLTPQVIPFTAIVVTFNEAGRLRACLDSLRVCEQIIAVDLGSSDHSVEIAREFGAEVVTHPRVPIGEFVLPKVVPHARHDWILRFDPDEIFDEQLAAEISRTICEHPAAAMIRLPHQYYFIGVPLRTTVWGGVNHINRVFHRDRVNFVPHVHNAVVAKSGYSIENADVEGHHAVQHYWVESFSQLFEKHRRYIQLEGPTRLAKGEHFTWWGLMTESGYSLYYGLFRKRGVLGGWRGFFLSFFYSWYIAMGKLSLRSTERKTDRRDKENDRA